MIAKLDDKNRIVIPKKMLQELDYKKDDELYLRIENDRLILERSKRNRIKKINYNNNIIHGCETCDWGSEYISDIEIIFENEDKLEISTNQMYEYVLTESDYMHALYISKNETDLVFNILKIIKEKVNNIETEIELSRTKIKVNGKEIEILKTLYSKNREIIYKEAE